MPYTACLTIQDEKIAARNSIPSWCQLCLCAKYVRPFDRFSPSARHRNVSGKQRNFTLFLKWSYARLLFLLKTLAICLAWAFHHHFKHDICDEFALSEQRIWNAETHAFVVEGTCATRSHQGRIIQRTILVMSCSTCSSVRDFRKE